MGFPFSSLCMPDSVFRLVVAFALVFLPWAEAFAPEAGLWGLSLAAMAFWGIALVRIPRLSTRGVSVLTCLVGFLALQILSLLNRGSVDPGAGFPEDGQLMESMYAWLPGTVAFESSISWLIRWSLLTGMVAWWISCPREKEEGNLWLGSLFLGTVFTVVAGLAGKAGLILPGFTDHHGIFQPFAYRNHAVAYASLGISAGLILAVKVRLRFRLLSLLLGLLSLGALVALPWSQSRFAFLPQLFLGSGLLFLGARMVMPAWRERFQRKRFLVLFGAVTALSLIAIWHMGDFTGRMRDTHRQINLLLAGEYPDLRLPAAGSALKAGWDRFPFGWGGGSYPEVLPLFAGSAFYAEVYQPETNNFGRLIPSPAAHNDWAEWWSEFGAIGLGLIFATLILMRNKAESGHTAERSFSLLGLLVLLVFSLFDYPLHSLPVLFAATVYWLHQTAPLRLKTDRVG
jgi:hypothetical protein